MQKIKLIIFIISIFSSSTPGFANKLQVQAAIYSAGYMGFISPSLGLKFNIFLPISSNLIYSYIPKQISGKDINALNLDLRVFSPKIIINPQLSIHFLFFSGALCYGLDSNLFIQNPPKYPNSNYYPPNAIRGVFGIGSELIHQDIAIALGVFYLDKVLESHLNDKDLENLIKYGSIGVSFNVAIQKN